MTKEDVIRMAHEVFDVQTDSRERTTFSGDSYAIEAFAALVASAERRECEKIIWNADAWIGSDAKIWLVKSIQEARGQA